MFITDPNAIAYQNAYNQTQIRSFGQTNVPTWTPYVPFGVPYNTVQQNYGIPTFVQQPIQANYGYNTVPNYGYNYNYGIGYVPVQVPTNVIGNQPMYGAPINGGWQQNVPQQQPVHYAFPWYGQQQGFVQGHPQQITYQGHPYTGPAYQGQPIQQQGFVQGVPNNQGYQQGPINQTTGPQGQPITNNQ